MSGEKLALTQSNFSQFAFKENISPPVESISKNTKFARIILRRDMDKNSLRASLREATFIIAYIVNQMFCLYY